jgi:hypothetical protein
MLSVYTLTLRANRAWDYEWKTALAGRAIETKTSIYGRMIVDVYANETGLYTDESPGLKVDPVIVLVLSLGFIFSVVALHSKSLLSL